MDEVKCKRESDKPNDETFLLLSTSLNSIPSSLFATQTNTSSLVPNARNQHICATPSTTITPTATTSTTTTAIASDRNNKSTCVTNTMPLSKSAIVHTCCYKHHCQLSACHINNGEIQASTSKKLLLSVPLQRKRKKVVYNQDFIGAIGIDVSNVLDLTSDQRLVIAHYSCVEKFTKTNMYTPSLKGSDSQTNPVIQSGDDQLISAIEQKEFPCPSDIHSCESSENKCDNSLAESLNTQRINSTSPLSDEGLANASPYCSSGEEEETRAPVHEKVERSSSSDSALGLDEEILAGMAELSPRNQQRRMTLTVTDIPLQLLRPALLPVAEPTSLPDSPLAVQAPVDFFTSNVQAPIVVPSKMILEARIVEIPTPASPAQLNDNNKTSYFGQLSRRESCVSDTTADEIPPNHIRVVRTPSVVVSDYSDDVLCGITLEELEFFRQQRKSSLGATLDSPHSSATENTDYLSDISAASSCSNLNYCGSSISLLDDNYASSLSGVPTPERKLSSCSTCSTGQEYNNDEECNEANQFSNNLIEALNQQQRKKKPSGWRKLRNIVQWTPFFQTYKKQRYPWVQLAGHQGNFKAGPDQGTVLKKLCPKEELCFHFLMKDVLRPYVPEYKGQVTSDDGELYLQLQDLLSDFDQPCVMDCKIGVRTYLEEELSKAKEKPKLRKDMYEKMIQIDKDAPNEEEHRAKGVTKPRYMVWRETISSTATLGFRIEGIKKGDGTSSKDFKTTKSRDQIKAAFKDFTYGFSNAIPKYIQRLKAIRATLQRSDFFQTHEVIGSSLLFVHDRHQASIWLIDFAKTVSLPSGANITHTNEWIVGNHEDGYLIGINNLIQIFEEILASEAKSEQSESRTKENEADDGDEYDIQELSKSNSVNCPGQKHFDITSSMQTQEKNVDLPQEIDAMKIDQTMQHSSHERTEENRDQDK